MLIAVAPTLIAFAAAVWSVAGWASGAGPFWPQPTLTLSEAAGLNNAGEVVRLITVEGQDPNRAWPVRDGILGDAKRVTPMEAAISIRRIELIRILMREGAIIPEHGVERAALICRAVAAGDGEIVDLLLATGDRSDPRATCAPPSTR